METMNEIEAAKLRDKITIVRGEGDAMRVAEVVKRNMLGAGFPLNQFAEAVSHLELIAKGNPDKEANLLYTKSAIDTLVRELICGGY